MTRLEEILLARELRASRQAELLSKNNCTLICFTMNIPGEDKNSRLVQYAFRYGLQLLKSKFGEPVLTVPSTAAGPEAYFLSSLPPQSVKDITTELETSCSLGRVFDVDVLDPDGHKLSRSSRRSCILCGKPVDHCVKAGTHLVAEARAKIDSVIQEFAADHLSQAAVQALLDEVHLTPKPGLVDMDGSGAHADMDAKLFEKSAESLRDYFRTSVMIGLKSQSCMPLLQAAGLAAEKTMFAATGGINTHKGAIYAFGLILGAMGNHLSFGAEIFSTAAQLAASGADSVESTHGDCVRKTVGCCGARFEAEQGFPHAVQAYHILRNTGNPFRALLHLMGTVPDTNILYRGGQEGLDYMQSAANALADTPDAALPQKLRNLDRELIRRNLSPGGCADLLALSIFLKETDWIWQ